jgi:hypothetical protein
VVEAEPATLAVSRSAAPGGAPRGSDRMGGKT